MIVSLIEQYRSEIDGQLSDKRRVIDNLLDVRLAAADRPDIIAETDRLLNEIPGLTTVENTWWRSALDDLALVASVVPTA